MNASTITTGSIVTKKVFDEEKTSLTKIPSNSVIFGLNGEIASNLGGGEEHLLEVSLISSLVLRWLRCGYSEFLEMRFHASEHSFTTISHNQLLLYESSLFVSFLSPLEATGSYTLVSRETGSYSYFNAKSTSGRRFT